MHEIKKKNIFYLYTITNKYKLRWYTLVLFPTVTFIACNTSIHLEAGRLKLKLVLKKTQITVSNVWSLSTMRAIFILWFVHWWHTDFRFLSIFKNKILAQINATIWHEQQKNK